MAGENIEAAARLWAAEDRILAVLEEAARRPATGATAPDLHDLHRVKAGLLARPFDIHRFAWELAVFLDLAGITPERFAELLESTA